MCQHPSPQLLSIPDKKYYHCPQCWLIFVDAACHLNAQEEKERYAAHNNILESQGYVDFLYRILSPALPHLHNKMAILDYGSGPNPVLSQLLEREGFYCDNYDPFFSKMPLDRKYDSIFCVETMEHFFTPKKEIERLTALLHPGGYLFVMTLLWADLDGFANWFYRRDPTHVCFYHPKTFEFICSKYGFILAHTDRERVLVLQKSSAAQLKPDE